VGAKRPDSRILAASGGVRVGARRRATRILGPLRPDSQRARGARRPFGRQPRPPWRSRCDGFFIPTSRPGRRRVIPLATSEAAQSTPRAAGATFQPRPTLTGVPGRVRPIYLRSHIMADPPSEVKRQEGRADAAVQRVTGQDPETPIWSRRAVFCTGPLDTPRASGRLAIGVSSSTESATPSLRARRRRQSSAPVTSGFAPISDPAGARGTTLTRARARHVEAPYSPGESRASWGPSGNTRMLHAIVRRAVTAARRFVAHEGAVQASAGRHARPGKRAHVALPPVQLNTPRTSKAPRSRIRGTRTGLPEIGRRE